MPLYEYRCDGCGSKFELLVHSSDQPRCPSCASEKLEKLFSVFAVGGNRDASAARELPEACRSCSDPRGPGACGLG